MRCRNGGRAILPTLAMLACAGCLRLDTTIRLREDGSATVTERVLFSQRMLEATRGHSEASPLEALLAREAATERAARMGKGAKLIRHERIEGAQGARGSLTVFDIPDLRDLIYLSPFVGTRGYRARSLTFDVRPQLSRGEWARRKVWPGDMIVSFEANPYAGSPDHADEPAAVSRTGSPLAVQTYRRLAPVFADMLDDFEVRIVFESYAPIRNRAGLTHRGGRQIDLLNFSGRHMDRHSYRFIRNEEIMLDMLLGHMGRDARNTGEYGPFWADHLGDMQGNPALPTVHQIRRGAVAFAPSRALFKEHLQGKTLDWSGCRNSELRARGKAPAAFEETGWRPEEIVVRETRDMCPDDCAWCAPKPEKP